MKGDCHTWIVLSCIGQLPMLLSMLLALYLSFLCEGVLDKMVIKGFLGGIQGCCGPCEGSPGKKWKD